MSSLFVAKMIYLFHLKEQEAPIFVGSIVTTGQQKINQMSIGR